MGEAAGGVAIEQSQVQKETPMRYLLLIYGDETMYESMSPETLGQMYQDYGTYGAELQQAVAVIGSEELQPTSSATCVRLQNGERIVTDGPFAETKEQLGGYYCIEADNLDQAIEWAARCPAAKVGTMEIRPIVDHSAGS